MESQVTRMCVACRQRGPQKALIRVVCDGVRVIPDPTQRAFGRGVYIHPASECIEVALKRKLLGRSLRVGIDVNTDAVANLLKQ